MGGVNWRSVMPLTGLVLAVVGAFGPWVGHKTAALTVTGFELAEFAKFFHQVQGGVVPVVRVLFLAPVVAAAVLLGLLANQPARRLSAWTVVLTLMAALLALAALPPYEYLLTADYRFHLVMALGGGALTLLTLLASRLPWRAWGVAVALLAWGGIVPAVYQFALLRPLVDELYGAPVRLGWGLVVCAIGFALLLAGGVWAAARPGQASPSAASAG